MGSKRITYFLASLILLMSSLGRSTLAQDRFKSVEEMTGKKVLIYDADELYTKYGPFLYIEKKGKLKAVKDANVYRQVFTSRRVFDAKSVRYYKDKKFIELTADSTAYFILSDYPISSNLNIRSLTYWSDLEIFYKDAFKYRHIERSDTLSHPCHQYKLIFWKGFDMPDEFSGDVSFTMTEYGIREDGTPLGNAVECVRTYTQLRNESTGYINQEGYDKLVRAYLDRIEKERQDSLSDLRPIIAKVRHTSNARNEYDKEGFTFEEDDDMQICLYAYNHNKYSFKEHTYSGYSLGLDMTLADSDLEFNNPDDAVFLMRRGNSGKEARKAVAWASDSVFLKKRTDSLRLETEKAIEKLEKIKSFYDKKKCFILSQGYNYDDFGQFGIDFKFYNCWSKIIKYIEIKLVPYNSVDDIQRDDIGRTVREVKCIGPVSPGDTAEYSFEKIWWDENDIINKVVATRVKITFKDNSVITYANKAQVDAHRANYTFEEMGIDD